jgi:hypothetical protein
VASGFFCFFGDWKMVFTVVSVWPTSAMFKSGARSMDNPFAPSWANVSKAPVRFRCGAVVMALFCFLCVSACCRAQDRDHDVLCSDGSGSFEGESHSGVIVRVRAARNGKLATRACDATLVWKKHSVTVATGASQIDVDAFGVDLGLGLPVAAFQVKKSNSECCMEYQIYSLERPPQLLRTITGGDFFSAADTDLDGRVEIWTDDAAAVGSFENLAITELGAAPTIVLRFDHGKLFDVSSEFQVYFDREIAGLRKELDSEDLSDFKGGDGKLSPTAPFSPERLDRLRGVKTKVLEIAWCYLYSGREGEAWRSLAEMWPTTDFERIRAAILSARTRGIIAQVNDASLGRSRTRTKRATIFDATSGPARSKPEVVPPEPILLRRPPLSGRLDQGLPQAEWFLELVIDSAGKVRSAEPAGKTKSGDADLIHAATGWKFIPAYKDGRAVASRVRLDVSPMQ